MIGIGDDEAQARFGFLLEALRYGAPPHGGIAYGLDRIVQRSCGADSIRDVIAFPKAASGADPLTGAPAPVDDAQLRELGLALRAPAVRGSSDSARTSRWSIRPTGKRCRSEARACSTAALIVSQHIRLGSRSRIWRMRLVR